MNRCPREITPVVCLYPSLIFLSAIFLSPIFLSPIFLSEKEAVGLPTLTLIAARIIENTGS
jgi:hypothetical protein